MKNKIIEKHELDYVNELFEHWKKTMGIKRAKLDAHRSRLIINAVKMYDVEDIRKAISGCAKSEFHMGINVQCKKYNGLQVILRDCEKIEKFIDIEETHGVTAARNFVKNHNVAALGGWQQRQNSRSA